MYAFVDVAMEATKTSNFTSQSKFFISIFFTCQNFANDIYSQTTKTLFSHLKFISRSCRWKFVDKRSGYETTSSLSERGLTHRSSSSSSSHHQHISFPIHDSARLSVFSKSRSNELTVVNVSFLKALSLHSTHTQVNSLS